MVSSNDSRLTSDSEGKLAVDVLSYGTHICVVAPIAGVDTTSIDVAIHNDILTIRGVRPIPNVISSASEYYHRECFWGPFSRTVVLPSPVIAGSAEATFSHGILSIQIQKQLQDKKIPITIVEE